MKTIVLNTIHAGFEFQIKIFRLDGKSFNAIGSDGISFMTEKINELIIGTGETFDLELNIEEDKIDLRFQLLADALGQDSNFD